jgi:spore maturation protein CgeB
VDKVRYYLSRDDERQRIAEAGHRKVTLGGNTYKDRLIQILEAVRALSG